MVRYEQKSSIVHSGVVEDRVVYYTVSYSLNRANDVGLSVLLTTVSIYWPQ